MKKNIGDRVTRQEFFDDGTWYKEGDACLLNSPLRHGTVIARSIERDDEIFVQFDNGSVNRYLDHGVNLE